MKVNDRYPFIFAANRDEVLTRPTASAHFWSQLPNLLAGKDLEAGGTWLGITTDGRFAALTNVREPDNKNYSNSRGEIIKRFFENSGAFLKDRRQLNSYGGFNLLYGSVNQLTYVSNRYSNEAKINQGIHVLSNASLNTPWPKAVRLRKGLEKLSKENSKNTIEDELFSLLINTSVFPDESLPDTGMSVELERFLSPIYIKGKDYGTRSSTVIIVDKDNYCTFVERNHTPNLKEKRFGFQLI